MSGEKLSPRLLKQFEGLKLGEIKKGSEKYLAIETAIEDERKNREEGKKQLVSYVAIFDPDNFVASINNVEILNLDGGSEILKIRDLSDKTGDFRDTYQAVSDFMEEGLMLKKRIDFMERWIDQIPSGQ